MATISEATIQQSTGEIRSWTADFTDDIPTGGSVTGGTATHTPPSGSASTPVISYTSTTVVAQLGPLDVVGIHYLDIQATYSDGQKSEVRIAFSNNYPATAARSTMSDLISDVRAKANVGPNDYQVAGVPYWSDAQVQRVLDRHRDDIYREQLSPIPKYVAGSTLQYFEYESQYKNFEQTSGGTAVFIVEDSSGNDQSTSNWSADYQRGKITFTANTAGTVYYLTGRSYDLNAAAADIWREKGAHYAVTQFDFSTDNMRVSRSQIVKHCDNMAAYYDNMAQPKMLEIFRSDIDPGVLV